jgi:hypothetical protein
MQQHPSCGEEAQCTSLCTGNSSYIEERPITLTQRITATSCYTNTQFPQLFCITTNRRWLPLVLIGSFSIPFPINASSIPRSMLPNTAIYNTYHNKGHNILTSDRRPGITSHVYRPSRSEIGSPELHSCLRARITRSVEHSRGSFPR